MFTHWVNEILGAAIVNIAFQSSKLERECTEWERMVRVHGPHRAKLIRRRLDEMVAAQNLAILYMIPGARCHQLGADLAGRFSVDLDHPQRLLFFPNHDPVPMNENMMIIRDLVTDVCIEGVRDTHG